ncbi:MAG: hypothetical protein N2C12_13185 [Planctomycetales bacterium]
MNPITELCPSCQFENHTTCHFCIRCGARLTAQNGPVQATIVSELEPVATVVEPDQTAVEKLDNLIKELGLTWTASKHGRAVEVPLESDRKQRVTILMGQRDEQQNDLLVFVSVCGPVDEKHAVRLLQANTKLTHCAYAIRQIGEQKMYVTSATQLAATADTDELRMMLSAVAHAADRLEHLLNDGEDRF